MTEHGHTHHAIDYIEFAVTDMAKSKRFYEAAFDWKFNDYGPDYAGIQKQGGEAGGLRLEPEVSPGGPLVILYSNDLETTITKVRLAGGRITTEPFEFPGVAASTSRTRAATNLRSGPTSERGAKRHCLG